MSALIEKLSRETREDPNDPLNPLALSQEIQTLGEALRDSRKMRTLAKSQHMDQYSRHAQKQHYINHRRQYQQFYESFYGKRVISEGEVRAIVGQGIRRGRR